MATTIGETTRKRAALGLVGPLVPPILLAAYPLLSLFQQNETELPLSVIWSPLAVVIAATVAVYAVLLAIFRTGTKAGALTSLIVVGFFYWGTFKSDLSGLHLSDGFVFALWLALLIAGAALIVRSRRTLANLTLGVGAAAAVLAVLPAIKIASYQANHPLIGATDPRLWSTTLSQPTRPAGSQLPDIYVIVPDDYARADVLKQYGGYDNSNFVNQLKQRGFVVSDQARSPYADSESNIAAELNMDYLNGLPKILGVKSQDVRPVKALMQDNRAARLLKPLGYRYVHIDSDEVTFAAGNPHISSVATPDSFTSLWLRKSVLRLVGGPLGFNDGAANERFRKAVRNAFSKLSTAPSQPGPKFVVFHTLIPHDPYVFGERGQAITFPGRTDQDLGSKLGLRYYVRQAQYMNRLLLDAVDTIKAKSKTPPVIVVQSDEGFQASEAPFGAATMKDIRVKGLLALHLPGTPNARAPEPPTTINTLRTVFNRYFGTNYPMLRAASYPEADFPYQYQEMRVR